MLCRRLLLWKCSTGGLHGGSHSHLMAPLPVSPMDRYCSPFPLPSEATDDASKQAGHSSIRSRLLSQSHRFAVCLFHMGYKVASNKGFLRLRVTACGVIACEGIKACLIFVMIVLQVVAVIYIALTVIVQMNIFATRNTSIWWWFGPRTAPPPSWLLAIPVALFLVGATFIAGMSRISSPLPLPPSRWPRLLKVL